MNVADVLTLFKLSIMETEFLERALTSHIPEQWLLGNYRESESVRTDTSGLAAVAATLSNYWL